MGLAQPDLEHAPCPVRGLEEGIDLEADVLAIVEDSHLERLGVDSLIAAAVMRFARRPTRYAYVAMMASAIATAPAVKLSQACRASRSRQRPLPPGRHSRKEFDDRQRRERATVRHARCRATLADQKASRS